MFTDRATLRTQAYADPGPLAARLAIYRWQRDPLDLPGLALRALGDVDGPVLDAGCGTGTYVRRLRADRPDLRVVAVDLSEGMRPDVVGDIQALPVRAASMGAGLAMHMLYHVPDIPAAVRELRRVIRPGGVLVVSTNGPRDKEEIGLLFAAAARDVIGTTIDPPDSDNRFTSEDTGLLLREFDEVEVEVLERESQVPRPEPVVAFVDSMRAFNRALLPDDVPWETFLEAVRRRVTAEITTSGYWRLGSQVGLMTCR